jgi:hypothetical protein
VVDSTYVVDWVSEIGSVAGISGMGVKQVDGICDGTVDIFLRASPGAESRKLHRR